jgi:hypothetical protein
MSRASYIILERPRRDRVVGGEVGLERVQRAGRKRQPDLKPEPGRDHPFGAQRAEGPVAGDRVVDPRPGIPVQFGAAGTDAEHRQREHHVTEEPSRSMQRLVG